MKFRTRALAYASAGAAGLFAAGAFAAPALAADEADVSVKAASSKIAIGAEAKAFRLDLKNAGPGVATDTTVTIDLSGLDPKQVGIDVEEFEGADVTVARSSEDVIVLHFGDGAPGETLPFLLPLFLAKDAKVGPAGTLKVGIESSAPDPDHKNNTVEVPVEVTESGVDLGVLAVDVYAAESESDLAPVPPGGTAPLFWGLFNQGDQAAKGLRIGITLPEHVSFVDDYQDCTMSADRRVLSCEDADAVLEPGYAYFDEEGLPVKVSEDAPGPVTLTGGSVKASAIGAAEEPSAARAARTAPAFGELTAVKVEEVLADIDPGDNDSQFSVFVGAAGGSGGGGELPVTGVQAGLIGGVGLAVLAGGGVLFLMARRRKLVLVTPDDETPTGV